MKEARTGDEALLLLERIAETDIHPGDRLLPGQATDFSTTDEKPWEKLPERIYPIRSFKEATGYMVLLAFLSLSWIAFLVLAWLLLAKIIRDDLFLAI